MELSDGVLFGVLAPSRGASAAERRADTAWFIGVSAVAVNMLASDLLIGCSVLYILRGKRL